MKTKKTAVAPKDATFAEICRCKRDNIESSRFTLMVGCETDDVDISWSENGISNGLAIPRKDFNKLVRWYLKPQKFIRK